VEAGPLPGEAAAGSQASSADEKSSISSMIFVEHLDDVVYSL
jgi:hypothetical protein